MQDLAEKQLRAFVLRSGEKRRRRVDLDDLTGIHEHDAVGDLAGECHFMGDDQHGHAVERERHHGVEDLLDHFRVERRGRFIEHHELRGHAQRSRDGDALLLAA
jgi:hypothetical protein